MIPKCLPDRNHAEVPSGKMQPDRLPVLLALFLNHHFLRVQTNQFPYIAMIETSINGRDFDLLALLHADRIVVDFELSINKRSARKGLR